MRGAGRGAGVECRCARRDRRFRPSAGRADDPHASDCRIRSWGYVWGHHDDRCGLCRDWMWASRRSRAAGGATPLAWLSSLGAAACTPLQHALEDGRRRELLPGRRPRLRPGCCREEPPMLAEWGRRHRPSPAHGLRWALRRHTKVGDRWSASGTCLADGPAARSQMRSGVGPTASERRPAPAQHTPVGSHGSNPRDGGSPILVGRGWAGPADVVHRKCRQGPRISLAGRRKRAPHCPNRSCAASGPWCPGLATRQQTPTAVSTQRTAPCAGAATSMAGG